MWKYRYSWPPNELFHYASPYYDPQKAHEYYMKRRELKGNKPSTAGLNEEGRIASEYVKKQIEDEHKEKDKEFKQEKYRQIAMLRASFKGMSKEEKAKNKDRFRKEINKMRKELQDERKRLSKEYQSKYESELSSMHEESSFGKTTKSGGNSK